MSSRLLCHLGAFAVLAFLLSCVGCKEKTDPQVFSSAQTALDEGLKAYEGKDYSAAVTAFDSALSGSGLLPDLYANALLSRAECNARLGNFSAAYADLDNAARGADMSEVHRVRSFVYGKEGQKTKSQQEYAKAKKINSTIKPIAD